MKNKHITTEDWDKLSKFATVIASGIMPRIPKHFHLDQKADVEPAVYDAFISLINSYDSAKTAYSLTTYCYQYAGRIALNAILREYKRLSSEIDLDELENGIVDDEDGVVHHQYGTYQIEPYTALEDHLDVKTKVDDILSKASESDRQIMDLVMAGYTLDEIADRYGVSKQAIQKKLRKYTTK